MSKEIILYTANSGCLLFCALVELLLKPQMHFCFKLLHTWLAQMVFLIFAAYPIKCRRKTILCDNRRAGNALSWSVPLCSLHVHNKQSTLANLEFTSLLLSTFYLTKLLISEFIYYVHMEHLFERQMFDPLILENFLRPAVVLNFTGEVFADELPVIRSAPLPALTYFYPALCLSVVYRLVHVLLE